MLWLITIMLTVISLTAALAHLLEMPAKMQYEAMLYVRLHRTLYLYFGRIAGTAEILAVIAIWVLVWKAWTGQLAGLSLILASAMCMLAAHGIYWAMVQPANQTMMSWPLEAIPANWTTWRKQWEYAHAARALLQLVALSFLILSLLKAQDGGK